MIIDAFIYDFSFLFCNSLLSITLDFSVVAPKTKFSTAEILQNSWEQIEEKEGTKDSDESFCAPSFSLGLSQDTTKSIPIQPSAVPEDVIDANPVSFVSFHGTEAVVVPFTDVPVDAVHVCVVPSSGTNAGPSEPKTKQKREKKPSMALMSPFKERIVDPRSALTPDENAICEWLFSLRGEPM